MSLEPTDPDMAVELYLADWESELSSASLYARQKRLEKFRDWCDEQGIDNLNELTGRVLHEYRLWRREDGGLAPPAVGKGEFVRDEMLESDRADEILSYLRRYHLASREHVAIALMWHTMMRVGAIRVLDVEDYDSDEQYLEVVHRPDTGTPIKNKGRGEREDGRPIWVCIHARASLASWEPTVPSLPRK